MKIKTTSNGILQIDDARIIFKNFEGREDTYNRAGDRNFALVIPTEEQADMLKEEGWNVKIKAPREEGDVPFMYLPVKVKYNEKGGPKAILVSGSNTRHLNEDTIGMLDHISIQSIDMDIRPFDWNMHGTSGRTAYLQAIWVTQKIDRFDERLEEEMV